MKLYRTVHVTEGGTQTKINQKWTAARNAKAQTWLKIRYRNYPILETKVEVADIPESMWKEWTP